MRAPWAWRKRARAAGSGPEEGRKECSMAGRALPAMSWRKTPRGAPPALPARRRPHTQAPQGRSPAWPTLRCHRAGAGRTRARTHARTHARRRRRASLLRAWRRPRGTRCWRRCTTTWSGSSTKYHRTLRTPSTSWATCGATWSTCVLARLRCARAMFYRRGARSGLLAPMRRRWHACPRAGALAQRVHARGRRHMRTAAARRAEAPER
jgi:hypothetical protein